MGIPVTQIRICSRCGSDKTYFWKKMSTYVWHREGRSIICKKCYNKTDKMKQWVTSWRKRNPDYSRIWNLENLEYKRELSKLWNLEHRDEMINYHRVRRLEQIA